MDADALVDPRLVERLLEDRLGAARRVGSPVLALEQVFLWAILLEVLAELAQNAFRQVDVPVLLAFGPADEYLHVAAVNVRHLQPHKFTDPQAHAVAQAQHGVVLQVRGMVEEVLHVRKADVLRQDMRFFRPWNLGEKFIPLQDLLEVELDGIKPGMQGGFAELQFVGAVQHIAAQAFRGEAVHRYFAKAPEQLGEFIAVSPPGAWAVSFELDRFHEPLERRPFTSPTCASASLPRSFGGSPNCWRYCSVSRTYHAFRVRDQRAPGSWRTRSTSSLW